MGTTRLVHRLRLLIPWAMQRRAASLLRGMFAAQ
jgi:hypothetical protein